jgi:protein-S-isoprenylcysteine O-methyltransferase Ste14
MSILGIGPILAIVGGGTIAAVVVCQRLFGFTVSVPSPWRESILIIGVVLVAVGGYFWLSSIFLVKRAFQSHRLVTKGVFRLSRNPLYAGFIVFIIPGLAFILNDLSLLLTSVTMFVTFKLRIRREEEFLAKEFGVEFEDYTKAVAQLIPFTRW